MREGARNGGREGEGGRGIGERPISAFGSATQL